MQDVNEVYAPAGDTLTATAGTGIATHGAKGVKEPTVQDQPGVHIVRFSTSKRYVRAKVTAEDNIGKGWILIANWPFKTL